jgi:Fis family transcriptional regulator
MTASQSIAKRNGKTRRDLRAAAMSRSAANGRSAVNGRELPLRDHTERALSDYFSSLNGHKPAHLYDMVIREVEGPLLRVVLDYVEGNQSRAAQVLGINRGTLRKKLRELGLAG